MNTDRIKEIQQETAYPDSVSVQQALLKVWNECEQENTVKNNAVLPHVSVSVCSCEMPAKVKGENECWRCKRPLKEFLQTER